MGVYDVYGKNNVQIKAGKVRMHYFKVGDKTPLLDGVYLGSGEGIIVIKNGVFIAELEIDQFFDRFGDNFTHPQSGFFY